MSINNQNIPLFLSEKLIRQYGSEKYNEIKQGYLSKLPVTLRINRLRTDKSRVKDVLRNEKIDFLDVKWYNDAIIILDENEDTLKKLDIYNNGEIYLQSLSSMMPVLFFDFNDGDNILDMTAAPGGKTSQIASLTDNKCYITAVEKNKIRADRLKYNIDKQGVKFVNIMQEDARNLSDFFRFDKILLDSPCSGSGTKNIFDDRFNLDLLSRLTKTQEVLLNKALTILKPGGQLIYSTCSILLEENEKILEKLLNNNQFIIEKINVDSSIRTLHSCIDGTVYICPSDMMEGFFIAKIRKKA